MFFVTNFHERRRDRRGAARAGTPLGEEASLGTDPGPLRTHVKACAQTIQHAKPAIHSWYSGDPPTGSTVPKSVREATGRVGLNQPAGVGVGVEGGAGKKRSKASQ